MVFISLATSPQYLHFLLLDTDARACINLSNMNLFKTLSHYVYLAQWFVRARFFGRRAPLQTVLFITDKCNLRCKHCSVYGSAGYKQRSFEDIVADMRYSYELGSRFIDLEGGEPTLWKEGDRNINDLIDAALEIGFFSITVTDGRAHV